MRLVARRGECNPPRTGKGAQQRLSALGRASRRRPSRLARSEGRRLPCEAKGRNDRTRPSPKAEIGLAVTRAGVRGRAGLAAVEGVAPAPTPATATYRAASLPGTDAVPPGVHPRPAQQAPPPPPAAPPPPPTTSPMPPTQLGSRTGSFACPGFVLQTGQFGSRRRYRLRQARHRRVTIAWCNRARPVRCSITTSSP